jgi:hypothetical protein
MRLRSTGLVSLRSESMGGRPIAGAGTALELEAEF